MFPLHTHSSGEGWVQIIYEAVEGWGQLSQVCGSAVLLGVGPCLLCQSHWCLLSQDWKKLDRLSGISPQATKVQGCSGCLLFFITWFNNWFAWAPVIKWQRTSTQIPAVAGPWTHTVAISIRLGPDGIMGLTDSTVFADWHGFSISMASWLKKRFLVQPWPMAVTWSLVVTRDLNFNTDTSVIWFTIQIWLLVTSWVWTPTGPQMAAQTTPICVVLASAWNLGTNMTLGGSPDPRHLHSLWW